jgi:alanine dehydrogenase
VPLYLSEADVESLLTPADAVPVIEDCFRRLAAGAVQNMPRRRLRHDDGSFALMAAVDRDLGYAGLKSYVVSEGRTAFVVCLFALADGTLAAVVEADTLGQRRTGAASGVAAKHLARREARSLGVIGCGWQARSQVEAIRAALPSIDQVVAYCRSADRLASFRARQRRPRARDLCLLRFA